MNLTTPVTEYGDTFLLEASDKILCLGSCFAQVVGQRLADYRMDIMLNPTGTLYNPQSIALLINSALDVAEKKTKAEDIVGQYVFKSINGDWRCWLAASLISAPTKEECLKTMASVLESIAKRIMELDVLMLTFGTDHYYCLNDQHGPSVAVANCHKMPAALFTELTMSIEQITTTLRHIWRRLTAFRPQLKVILTVSPYRYLKYGLHNSMLSKSRLLIAIDMLQQSNPDIRYFPAYEILNDELRDYRFYAPDMVHPSQVAQDYIWQIFIDKYISSRLKNFFEEWTPILKYQAHRPYDNNLHTKISESCEAKIKVISIKYPEMFRQTSNK